MKPEIVTISFEVIGIRVFVKADETLTASAVIPTPSQGVENLTIGQIRDAALKQAKDQMPC